MKERLSEYLGSISGVGFRPIGQPDMPFLRKVYRSTRENELDGTGWSESQKAEFIHQQFEAQHQHYTKNYNGPFLEIILIDEVNAGRLYLVEWDTEIRIMDIALLPEFRNKGWGGKILQQILTVASSRNKMVGIHVEYNNPAKSLYQKLGFALEEDKGIYHFMVWRPHQN